MIMLKLFGELLKICFGLNRHGARQQPAILDNLSSRDSVFSAFENFRRNPVNPPPDHRSHSVSVTTQSRAVVFTKKRKTRNTDGGPGPIEKGRSRLAVQVR
jgi:hypothetical protein